MDLDPRRCSQMELRAIDSNSLLRMHDRAHEILKGPALPRDRARADMAARRIARELERRNVKW